MPDLSGNRYYADPNLVDTDQDGLDDGAEIIKIDPSTVRIPRQSVHPFHANPYSHSTGFRSPTM
jgi:hypothetical protein